MTQRKIIVDGQIYYWRCGKQHVVIQDASGKSECLRCSDLTGITDWDRARRKGYGTVKPSHIKSWILSQGKEPPT